MMSRALTTIARMSPWVGVLVTVCGLGIWAANQMHADSVQKAFLHRLDSSKVDEDSFQLLRSEVRDLGTKVDSSLQMQHEMLCFVVKEDIPGCRNGHRR